MNAMRQAQLTLGILTTGMMFFAVAPFESDSQVAVYDAPNHLVNTVNGAKEIANQVAAYSKQLFEIDQQAQRIAQEVRELQNQTTFLKSPTNLNNLTSHIVSLNNQDPTTAGTQLAKILIASQNGAVGAGDLSNLQQEVSNATGNLQGISSNVDGAALSTSAIVQNTQLNSVHTIGETADLNEMRYQYEYLLDLDAPPYSGGYGGFSARGINDYSSRNVL